jgi:hypothetical protein
MAIRGTTSGTLWVWGKGSSGQLGRNSVTSISSPVQLGTLNDWIAISTFNDHSAGIRSNGTLWTWGDNSFGQLGIGLTASRSSPVQVGSGTTGPWVSVSCGSMHTAAITNNGTLWIWGRNNNGQLGMMDTVNRSSPVQVGTGTTGPWTVISCGYLHTHALRENQTLWAWGDGFYIGNNNFSADRSSPVQIGSQTWSAVQAGLRGGLGIRTDGSLWSWGWSPSVGVIGIGNSSYGLVLSPVRIGTESNWSAIFKPKLHAMAIDTNSNLWGWGSRGYGECAVPLIFSESKPVQVGLPPSNYKPNRDLNLGSDFTVIIR